MRYETANAFRTALEQRLKNEAEATGVALLRLRKRVAFERFLARLTTSESSGWVLKGAFALELRLGLRARTTKDIDLGRADDEEAATEHLEAATHVDLGDFFVFEVRRTPALDAATGFHAEHPVPSATGTGASGPISLLHYQRRQPTPSRKVQYLAGQGWSASWRRQESLWGRSGRGRPLLSNR